MDIYLILNETPHGKRYWTAQHEEPRVTGDIKQVFGPAEVGPDLGDYNSIDAAIEAIADIEEINLDDPDSWPIYRGEFDIPVKLACGCECVWHEGDGLYKNAYVWCEEHQEDTTVEEILR